MRVKDVLERVFENLPEINFQIRGEFWKKVDRSSSYGNFDNWDDMRKLPPKEQRECSLPNLDLSLLKNCLLYHRETKEPLPDRLIVGLLLELDLALSGRETRIFNKPAGITKQKTHPSLDFFKKLAVAYDTNAKKYQYDEYPIDTLASVCSVNKSTIHSWRRKYPETEIPVFESEGTAAAVLILLKKYFDKNM